MKKTYKNPEMDVIEIEMHQSVLTVSAGFGSGTKPGGSAAAPDFVFDEELPSF